MQNSSNFYRIFPKQLELKCSSIRASLCTRSRSGMYNVSRRRTGKIFENLESWLRHMFDSCGRIGKRLGEQLPYPIRYRMQKIYTNASVSWVNLFIPYSYWIFPIFRKSNCSNELQYFVAKWWIYLRCDPVGFSQRWSIIPQKRNESNVTLFLREHVPIQSRWRFPVAAGQEVCIKVSENEFRAR